MGAGAHFVHYQLPIRVEFLYTDVRNYCIKVIVLSGQLRQLLNITKVIGIGVLAGLDPFIIILDGVRIRAGLSLFFV